MRTVEPEALRRRTASMEEAIASRTPPEVSFRVAGPPQLRGQLVTLAGDLENSAEAPREVFLFPVAAFGFLLEPTAPLPRKPGGPPLPPPVPPLPLAVTLPPRARVRVTALLDLSPFVLPAAKELELRWQLLFWNEPRPGGILRVTLP
jgi:hypothetical protein